MSPKLFPNEHVNSHVKSPVILLQSTAIVIDIPTRKAKMLCSESNLLKLPACITDYDYIVRGTELKAGADDSLLVYLVCNDRWFLCPCSMTSQPLLACSKGFRSSKLHYVHQRGIFIPPNTCDIMVSFLLAKFDGILGLINFSRLIVTLLWYNLWHGWQFHSGHCHLCCSRFWWARVTTIISKAKNHCWGCLLRLKGQPDIAWALAQGCKCGGPR